LDTHELPRAGATTAGLAGLLAGRPRDAGQARQAPETRAAVQPQPHSFVAQTEDVTVP